MTAFPVCAVPLAAKDFLTKVLLPRAASSLWSLFLLCAALLGWGVSWDGSIKTCINGTRDLKRYSPHVLYKIPGFQDTARHRCWRSTKATKATDLAL